MILIQGRFVKDWKVRVEKAMAPHSSTLAWKIPWMEEPGGLQSLGSLRVRHDWETSLSLFMHWRRKWQPTPVFLPENPRDGRAWWAAEYGVAQSRTRLKRLSSSSSSTGSDGIPVELFQILKRRCCESATFNMPANLENSAVATGLEKVSFHSNPKERQCQRMLKLPHNCTHLTH